MADILIMFFSIILTENYSLTKFFSFMGVEDEEDKTKNLGALGLVLTIILLLSVSFIYPIHRLLLKYNLEFLYILLSVALILIVTRLVKYFIKKFFSLFYDLIRNSLLVITINSTLLGTVLITMNNKVSFFQAILSALAAGVGYTLAVMIFQGINFRVKESDIPSIFKGTPILLISAFIASMAFEGFSGILLGILS